MLETIKKSTSWIRKRITQTPDIAIILGSGLHKLAEEADISHRFSYREIPGFPVPEVKGHHGEMLFGQYENREVMILDGRFHYYEGYSMEVLGLPVRVMKMLGVSTLFISNAAGGMRPGFSVGDLMVVEDHINLMGTNPLIGRNLDTLGPRFPDMSNVYDPRLREIAAEVAKENGIVLHSGVYAAVSGPVYETPAEYRFLHRIGADAVGMSTVPEAIVARHMGMKLFAISVITDLGIEGHTEAVSHDEVLQVAGVSAPKMITVLRGVINRA